MPTPPVRKPIATAPKACATRTPPIPLTLLRIQHRSAWRCLRTALAFPDFAHLARRLHLSHAELRARLQQLDQLLGAQQLWLDGGQIQLCDTLRRDALDLLSQPALHPGALTARQPTSPELAHPSPP
ncbi:hypothetical protein [Roseateles sp. PN1]|uniref:hypothetical protein n=1 Tax=Roseateles sp. PN1 TaxID=3137372 RepID=UPI003138CBCD